jgi:hypothetical protein
VTATVGQLQATGYWLTRLLSQQAVAAVYLVAFAVAVDRFRRFSTPEEHRHSEAWWVRTKTADLVVPPRWAVA